MDNGEQIVSNKRAAIKNSQLFWNVSDAQIDRVEALCKEQSFEAGVRILSEGDTSPNFYIVESGKIALEMEIRIGSRTKRQAVIDVVEKHGVFGWSALTDLPVHTMSATASEKSMLLVFDAQSVRRLCNEDSDLDHKVMQELVKLVSDRLSQAKRTLAHVLSVTSHDLRAPLATVQSSMDTVIGGFAGDVNIKQKELLSGGRQRISDLLSMIDNLLDISFVEIRAIDFEKMDLSEVVAISIGDVSGIAQEKAIGLRSSIPSALPATLGIPKRLRQVLTNLLSNAIKFTAPGGIVTVTARETDDKIELYVSDTGIGIPPEELPRIFGDFYRGMKVDAEGAGLGLSIAKKIVEAHGGSIWAVSPDPETGKGTRFGVSLPRILEPSRGQAEEKAAAVAGARILVADDDPEMLGITALILESQGYEVRTAQDGKEALAKVEEEEPDLLVLDLLMPNMDGFEVCKRLEERRGSSGKRIPVIILSAVREESSRRRYELETETEFDIEDYVTKPISPPVLLQRVEKALMKGKAVGATSLSIIKGGKQWTSKSES
jgi:signal transduction histidine kinase/DNA-binding NarL/FixJ family response regulator